MGGVKDKYNFDFNIHYDTNFEEELFKEQYMITELQQEEKRSMNLLFGVYTNPILIERINEEVKNNWKYIKVNEPLTADKFVGEIVTKRFEKTISDNIRIIEEFIKQVCNIAPECKIIFTLIPRYITMEKTLSVFMRDWKREFNNIICGLQGKYGVYFIDYKNRTEISGNNHLFWDINHLNTMGGRCMTSILNEDIRKISESDSNEKWLVQ